MKKIFTLIATALMTLGVNAQTETLDANNKPAADKGTVVGTSFTAGENGELTDGVKGEFLKIRTGNNNAIVFSVNSGYTITGISVEAYSNNTSETADRSIAMNGIYIDGSETNILTESVSFPGGTAGQEPVTGGATGFSATSSIKLSFDNSKIVSSDEDSKGKNKQIFAKIIFTFTTSGGGEGGGGGATGETESYLAVTEDGSAASTEFANPTTEGTDLVVSFTKGNVTLKAVASRTPADIDDASGAGLNQDTWTKWNDSKWDGPKKQNDISFYWMQGSGNPYISFVSEQKSKDGEPLDAYKANYTYYAPDGSKGLPICGEYVEITAKADGMFKIGFWANKGGSRKLYLVDKESKKALIWDADETKTQYKVEGYVNGWDEEWVEIVDGNKVKKAKKRFIPYIQVNDFVIGDPAAVNDKVLDADFNPTTKVVDQVSNNAKFGWFVFDAKANNTYMIFGSDWQFGFQGYQFTPGATISDYHASDPTGIKAITTKTEKVWNADAPMYNLSGQKVDKSYKGIVIQNGRKFVNK